MTFFVDNERFTGPPITSELIRNCENELGYHLPQSYLQLLSERNGGVPFRRCFPTSARTSWAPDHIKIDAILGIGGEWGIDSKDGLGSADMIKEWGYPNVGVVICATPSAGHDTVMLDYSKCGAAGEPRVIYVDEEDHRRHRPIHVLADSFANFVAHLVDCSQFPIEI